MRGASDAGPPAAPGRVALIAGSVGKVGEELLNQLLASPHTTKVHALTRWEIEASIDKLEPHAIEGDPLPLEASTLAFPPFDEFYCCVSGERSYYGRDAIYHRVTLDHVLPLARAAAQRGARRAAILMPMEAIQQMSRISENLAHERELGLTQLGFEMLVIVRPVERVRGDAGGFLRRVGDTVVSVLASYMTPGRYRPRRAVVIARAAIDTVTLAAPGVHVIPIHKLLEEMAGA